MNMNNLDIHHIVSWHSHHPINCYFVYKEGDLTLSLSLISAEHNLSNNVDTEDTSPFGGCLLHNIAK